MKDTLDRKMDRLMKSVGDDWADESLPPDSDFLLRFEAELREEKVRESTLSRLDLLVAGSDGRGANALVIAHPRPRFAMRSGSRLLPWGLFVVAASVLIVAGLSAVSLLQGRAVGALVYQRGGILASGSGRIAKGSTLAAAAGEGGVVNLNDGRVALFLDGETEMRVNTAEEVEIKRGSVWAAIQPNSGFFQVATPHGNIDVHGATFGVVVDATGARVSVQSGSVTATTPRDTRTLSPGEEILLPAGEGLNSLAVVSAEVAKPAWVVDLETEAAGQEGSNPTGSGDR